jgi:excisionase family DNA binding protein
VIEKKILSVKEVAELLGCSVSHVRRLLNGKVPDVSRIPHMRAGRGFASSGAWWYWRGWKR